MWQWINQSYNAIFNYCNRNTSTASSTKDIVTAYLSATVVSVRVALAGDKAEQKLDAMLNRFEYALVVLLCLSIGLVLLSVMLPLAGMLSAVGG